MKLSQLLQSLNIVSSLGCLIIQPVVANEGKQETNYSQLENSAQPSTYAADLLAQETTSRVAKITGVKLNPTDAGLEVLLESDFASTAAPVTRTEGNIFIAELENAVLMLPEGQGFQAINPVAGITRISVTQVDETTIEVSVVGTEKVPTATIRVTEAITAQQSAPAELDEGEEEIVATGTQNSGYRIPNASTGTKTDTPIRDIPASIQVIPREVIRDQGATNVRETVRNVSGVTYSSSSGNRDESFVLRGFNAEQFENGFRNDFFSTRTQRDLANIQQVEVLKGPASILFGRVEPSGVVNFVTKQPLLEPFYELGFTAGSFSFFRPTADLSGPITKDKNLAYRFNIAYENAGSFRDRVQSERIFLAPSLSWQISPDTKLSFDVTHLRDKRSLDRGIVVLSNNQIADIPISRVLGDPTQQEDFTETRATLALEHRFSSNISLKSAFRYSNATENGPGCTLEIFGSSDDDRNYPVSQCFGRQDYNTYTLQNDLTVKFKTGSIQHTLLIGTELSHLTNFFTGGAFDAGLIDIFNPNYNFTLGSVSDFGSATDVIQTFGIYVQDQITILKNLKVLVGGRFDTYNYESENDTFGPKTNAQAFSPRLGIVYQPIPEVSLYGSYSRSFTPEFGRNSSDQPFKPKRGTGYEVGIKTDLLKGRLSSTLAFYNTTLSNILTEDSDPDTFGVSVQVGEQRSRGIELDIAGEILPGWKVIAAYAHTDAVITKDNVLPVGNHLENVPRNSASLWSTYTLQSGTFKGFGLGFGVFAVGERAGDLENSFVLPGYVRLDAALFYQKDNLRIGLNFKNLSNTRYFEGSQGREQVIPGAPFGISGTVSYSF